MQIELIADNTPTAQSSTLALFLAAFDGVPHPGSRELRLNEEERRELKGLFPQAEFTALSQGGESCWYRVTLA